MKKFGFNKQITGRNKKVFSDAIQEKKGTLHNSHLHYGFNEAVVKIVTLSILILLLISCKQKVLSQPCQNLIVKSSNNVFLLGDSIVANSAFSNQVNTSCATGKEGCILEKLTTDYYSSLSKESGSVLKLDKTHQLIQFCAMNITIMPIHFLVMNRYITSILTNARYGLLC